MRLGQVSKGIKESFTSSFLLKKLIAANIDECSRSKLKALFVDRTILRIELV
jgi:hypothetical protein